MTMILNKISSIILSIATVFFGVGGGVATKNDNSLVQKQIDQYVERSAEDGQVFGATLPVAGHIYNLAGQGISSSATSIILTSLTIKQTGQKILDADLSDTFYITLEPGNTSKQEIVSCTTVTQGTITATLSGCSRGLSPITPYSASTTLSFVHNGGSQVIFSDPPQLFNLYGAKANNEYITGQWGFTNPPYFVNAATSTSQAASVAYVNTLSFGTALIPKAYGGTGVASFPTNSFIFDSGAGTTLSASSSPTVDALWATSTKLSHFQGALEVVGNTTLTGNLVASSTTNIIASSTQYIINAGIINATSTIKLNGVALAATPPQYSISGSTLGDVNNAYATSSMISIPANLMTASSTITFDGEFTCDGSVTCRIYLVDATGAPFCTDTSAPSGATLTHVTSFHGVVVPQNSVSSQRTNIYGLWMQTSGAMDNTTQRIHNTTCTSSINLAAAFQVGLKIFTSGDSVAQGPYSIVVNP